MKDSKEKLTKALANFENEYIEFVVLNTIENVVEGGKALEIYANGKVLAVLSEKSSVEPVFHFVVKQSELVKLLIDKNKHIKTHKEFLKLPEKQSERSPKLRRVLYYANELGISDEIKSFLSQLLETEKSILERTFTKEELEIIAYSVASYTTSKEGETLWKKLRNKFTDYHGDDNDELKAGANELISKISKLLKEEE